MVNDRRQQQTAIIFIFFLLVFVLGVGVDLVLALASLHASSFASLSYLISNKQAEVGRIFPHRPQIPSRVNNE